MAARVFHHSAPGSVSLSPTLLLVSLLTLAVLFGSQGEYSCLRAFALPALSAWNAFLSYSLSSQLHSNISSPETPTLT